MVEVTHFGIDSSSISRRPAGRDFFENHAALFRTDWGKEPSMVCSAKTPTISENPETVPGDAMLRNALNHFAIQWLGLVLKKYGVLWQVETSPRELGVHLQYL